MTDYHINIFHSEADDCYVATSRIFDSARLSPRRQRARYRKS